MSEAAASRLGVGIDVLVPPFVPAPFGGDPEIQAYQGFYSLYWLIPGAPPTYLRITGEAGGVIPAYSKYDRNNQLVQNASVQGYPAYHDLTPIYDLVYWQVGNVVYTVESHNLAGDDSLSLANSLMVMSPPVTEEPVSQEEPGAGEGTGAGQQVEATLTAPSSVPAGSVASIQMNGMPEAYLVTGGGYFLATGEVGTYIGAGAAVDWQAPTFGSDTVVTFSLYELSTDRYLTAVETIVEAAAAPTEDALEVDLQCPARASIEKQARILVTGTGFLTVAATDGLFPAESPNTDFRSDAPGNTTLGGTMPTLAAVALSWLAPSTPMTVDMTVSDAAGTVLDACVIEVVLEEVTGDLGPDSSDSTNTMGDGTGILDVKPEVVARVIANPIGFAGDASGGPEANGPDYGLVVETAENSEDSGTVSSAGSGSGSAGQGNQGLSTHELGPVSGPNGMVAQLMSVEGGTLACPAGATAVVPPGAIPGEATVTISPVADTKIPPVEGVTVVPGTAFDLTFSGPDGRSIDGLERPISLTIALKSASSDRGAKIFRVDGASLMPMELTHADSGSVSTEITNYGRVVVGIPDPVVASAATMDLNLFLIGGFGALALVSAGLLFSRGLQRKKPRMIPTRRPAQSRVRVRYR
jgi:hypothetical protein